MAALKPITGRAQVLYAALLLDTFTAQDLAEFCGVKVTSVRTVLERDASFFVSTDVESSGKPGGQFKRYVLTEAGREQLKSLLVGLPAAEQLKFGSLPAAPEQDEEDLRLVFKAAAAAVKQAEELQGSARNLWLLRAEQQFTAAQVCLRALLTAAPKEEWQGRLSQLESRIRILKSVNARHRLQIPRELMVRLRQSAGAVHRWLLDWSFRLDGIETTAADAATLFDRGINPLLKGAVDDLPDEDVLLPAATYLAARPHLRIETIQDCRSELEHRLRSPESLEAPGYYTALIACAAVMGAEGSLYPILGTIATHRFASCLSGVTRQIALQSIARFARPTRGSSSQQGALACYLLLSQSSRREHDMRCLLPGALLAQNVDALSMLEQFARIYYGLDAHQEPLTLVEERAFMRNLAIVLNAFGFDGAQPYARRLLMDDAGGRLLETLKWRHDAINLRDDDVSGFVWGPGYALLRSGDVSELFELSLDIDPRSSEGQRLNHMLLKDSSTLALETPEADEERLELNLGFSSTSPSEESDDEFVPAGVAEHPFSAPLRQRPWIERRKVARVPLGRPT